MPTRKRADRSTGDNDVDLQRILALRSFPSIEALTLSEVALIAGNLVETFLPAGTVVARAGTRPTLVHMITRGRIDSASARGAELTFGPNMIFGVLTALSREVAKADAVAAVDTWTLALTHTDIDLLLDESFMLLRGIARSLSDSLVQQMNSVPLAQLASSFPAFAARVPKHELDLAERILMLKAHTFGIGSKRIQALAAIARDVDEVRIPAGTTVWRRGDPAEASLLLLEGKMRFERGDGVAWTVEPLHAVGALESLGSSERWFELTCVSDVRALRIDTACMLDVFEDHTLVARDVVQTLARGLDLMLDTEGATLEQSPI